VGNTNGLSLFLDAYALAFIAEDPEAKAKFDSQMVKTSRSMLTIFSRFAGRTAEFATLDSFQFPECNASADPKDIAHSEEMNAFVFGRWGLGIIPYALEFMQPSLYFPRGMATEALFPAESSLYTDPETGILYNSPCFRPNAEAVIESIVCPPPFLAPTTDEFIGIKNCIKPCPVQAYNDEEYDDMWIISSVPACLGLAFNMYIAMTWYSTWRDVYIGYLFLIFDWFLLFLLRYMGGEKVFEAVNFNLKMCVICGLLYGIIDTIPVLILGKKLPW
jgi:hypothetical protein